MGIAQTSPGAPLNLPFPLTYVQPKADSRGGRYYIKQLRSDIVTWLENENIKYNYSGIFSSLWFESEEDKVRFILQWM